MPDRLNSRFIATARIFALPLALLAGVGAADAHGKADNLVPTGEPVNCLQLNQVRSTHVRDDQTIDFIVGKKVYRNTLPRKCPGLGFNEQFMIETSLHELCSVDSITVLHNWGRGLSRGASCGLGKFQPMVKAAK